MLKLLQKVDDWLNEYELIYPKGLPCIYALLSSLLSTIFFMLAKLLRRISSPQTIYFRSGSMLAINTYFVITTKAEVYKFPPVVKSQLISRGIFGALGASMIFEGLKYVTLSENVVLVRTNPIWTALISIFIMKKERFSFLLIMSTIFGFFGVVLIARPPQITPYLRQLNLIDYEIQPVYQEHFTYGVVFSLLGAVALSAIQAVTSSLIKSANQLAVIQYNNFIQVALGVAICYLYGDQYRFVWPNLEEYWYIFGLGSISYVSQYVFNRSLIKGQLTQIAMIGQTTVIWAVLFDVLLIGEDIELCSLLGAAIIVGSIMVLILEKQQPKSRKISITSTTSI